MRLVFVFWIVLAKESTCQALQKTVGWATTTFNCNLANFKNWTGDLKVKADDGKDRLFPLLVIGVDLRKKHLTFYGKKWILLLQLKQPQIGTEMFKFSDKSAKTYEGAQVRLGNLGLVNLSSQKCVSDTNFLRWWEDAFEVQKKR